MHPESPSTPSVCVVGSGWQFTSGISYYTCRLATELDERWPTSAILMRRLIPRWLYPGKARVGVSVNSVTYPGDMPVYDGVDWFWLPTLLNAVRFLKQNRPNVIVFQWWTGAVLHSYLVLAIAARALGCSVVIEFHEVQDTGEIRLPGASAYLNILGRSLVRRSQGFVVHSDFDRRAILQRFPNIDGCLTVIPHGPYDQYVTPGSGDRASSSGAPDTVNILFFGTIRPYKGLEFLVEAFERLCDERPGGNFALTIVGETWEGWDAPVTAARQSRHADRIEIINRYVHDDEVGPLFEAADVVALPYTRSSASGPLHIAMAHGLPVVLTDVGGLRAAGGDYAGARWVRPENVDDLVKALASSTKRDGVPFSDPRSWDRTADLFADLFTELLETDDTPSIVHLAS